MCPSRHRTTLGALGWVALGAAALSLGCGHSIGPGLAENYQDGFDFLKPPKCSDPPSDPAPADAVVVRYLGAGGLYVGWRGKAILAGPFFSNPNLLRIGLGRMRIDREAISRGLAGVPTDLVGAILVGHSHYDHLGDVPVVAELARGSTILVNRSGVAALEAYPELEARVRAVEPLAGSWSVLYDAYGDLLPFRIYPVPSDHAPHFDSTTLMDGETRPFERPWEEKRYRALRTGRTHALVIDLLDAPNPEAEVRFRILYQDAASPAPAEGLPLDRPYDLAVLCAASADLVPAYPRRVLKNAEPAHTLVTHYENFFADWGPGHRFVIRLTRKKMHAFLEEVDAALARAGDEPPGPIGKACGPSARRWTIPLVGEWMTFRPSLPGEAGSQPASR